MSRDHRRLRVYHSAHALTRAVYKETADFPCAEAFGIRSQIRRAAVSVTTNIVEGNARRTTREYVSFLNVARGSAAEISYLVLLSSDLGYLSPTAARQLSEACNTLIPQLEALIQRMEQLTRNAPKTKTND